MLSFQVHLLLPGHGPCPQQTAVSSLDVFPTLRSSWQQNSTRSTNHHLQRLLSPSLSATSLTLHHSHPCLLVLDTPRKLRILEGSGGRALKPRPWSNLCQTPWDLVRGHGACLHWGLLLYRLLATVGSLPPPEGGVMVSGALSCSLGRRGGQHRGVHVFVRCAQSRGCPGPSHEGLEAGLVCPKKAS